MKSYDEAVNECVQILRGPKFSSVRSVYTHAAGMTISSIYEKELDLVFEDIGRIRAEKDKQAEQERKNAQAEANRARHAAIAEAKKNGTYVPGTL